MDIQGVRRLPINIGNQQHKFIGTAIESAGGWKSMNAPGMPLGEHATLDAAIKAVGQAAARDAADDELEHEVVTLPSRKAGRKEGQ